MQVIITLIDNGPDTGKFIIDSNIRGELLLSLDSPQYVLEIGRGFYVAPFLPPSPEPVPEAGTEVDAEFSPE